MFSCNIRLLIIKIITSVMFIINIVFITSIRMVKNLVVYTFNTD